MKKNIFFSIFLSFLLLLSISFSTWAEEAKAEQNPFTLEVTDNLINLKATQASAKEILNDLEKKTGIKIKIFDGVDDKRVTVKISALPVYAIHTLLEKIAIENFAVVYDRELSSKIIYILPKGKDIAEVIKREKGKTIIRPAQFADRKNINQIKGHEISTITRGKNNIPIRYVKDELLLKFQLGVTREEIEEILKRYNLVLADDESLSKIGYIKTSIPDGREVFDVIKEIGKEYKVKIPEPNYIAETLTVNDPLYGDQWYVQDTNFDKAWDKAESTNEVKIAVIDTGVNTKHPDLKGKILKGYDFVNDDSDASDDHGHGTFVAGIISATANNIGIKGLYDYAQIIPLKVINENGFGTYEDTAKGIIYAADNGAKVINLSIGSYAYSFMLQDAVDYALSKGAVVVAAGGNDGIEYPIYPAGYPDVIGVSALGYNGQIWSSSNSGRHIDVSAPGVNILSTGLNESYVYASGTSASTPMVSALAGMLVSEKPELSSSFIERIITQSAKDLGDEGRDKVYGNGEIDAYASLEQEVEPFHDVAVRNVSIEPMIFDKGKSTYIVANIENTGTYKSEKFDVVFYEIIGEEKKEIGRKNGVAVIDKTKVIFDWKPKELKENIKFEVTVFSEDDEDSSNNSKTTSIFSVSESEGMYVLHKVDPPVHQYIANEAFKLLIDGPMKTDMQPHLGGVGYYGNDAVGNDNYLLEGVSDEDEYGDDRDEELFAPDGNLCSISGYCWKRYINHGWDPDEGYYSKFIPDYVYPTVGHSAIEAAEAFWGKAISNYLNNNKGEAYWWLGRIAHLMGDMSVPAHTHLDIHIENINDDEYEEWMRYNPITGENCIYDPNNPRQCNFENYTVNNADVNDVRYIVNGQDRGGIAPTNYSSLTMNADYMWANGVNVYQNIYWNGSLPKYRTNLFKLMLDMAERTDEYESDDSVGEAGGYTHWIWSTYGLNDVKDAELFIHAEELMKEAFQHIAGLYQLFWDTTHPPSINDVRFDSPLGCLGDSNREWIDIDGEWFLDSSKVILNDGTTAYEIPEARTDFIDNTNIRVCAGVRYTSNWTAQIINPVNSSNIFPFTVPVPGAPTVSISAYPSGIASGGSSTISWSSTNSTSCTASGGWSGVKGISGSEGVTPGGTTTYTLTCTGSGGSASNSTTVTVSGGTLPPMVSLGASPDSVSPGQQVGLGWATAFATSCTASNGWSGSKPLTGNETVFPTVTTTYTLTCTGAGGTNSDSVTVNVGTPAPISLTAVPSTILWGDSSTLSWATNGMASCTASNGWSGSKPLNGSTTVSPTSYTTYTLTCNESGGTPTELVQNGAFSGATTEWTRVGDFYADSIVSNCLSCPGYAYLSSADRLITNSNNLVGWIYQDIPLPATASSITLNYWVSISTLETTTSNVYDSLITQIKTTSGTILSLVSTLSNLNAGGYRLVTFDLSNYKGQIIRLEFLGATDGSNGTVFRIDDVSVNATIPAQYSDSASVTVTLPPPPTLTFSAVPDSINSGGSSVLSWSSTNATSCNASGGWSGAQGTSGSRTVYPIQNTTYSLSCTGLSGSVSKNATVAVTPPPPTVSLSASPATINEGDTSTLTWSTTNATSCTAYGEWGGEGSKATSGSQIVSPTSTASYVLSCSGVSGTTSDTATISVVPHTITITAVANGTPNPVDSGGVVSLSVSANDSLSHGLNYAWSASCPGLVSNGAFNNVNIQNPTWVAPANTVGGQENCTITASVDDGAGLTSSSSYLQVVNFMDETEPVISNLTSSNSTITEGVDTSITISALVDDSTTGNSNIVAAEYYIGNSDPGEGNGTSMTAVDGTFNSPQENVQATIDTSTWTEANSPYTVNVRGKDAAGNWSNIQSMSITVNPSEPVDRYVSEIGTDAGDCTDYLLPCATIQYAIDVAVDNDTINVAQGTYNENISVTSSIDDLLIQGGWSSDFSTWSDDPSLTAIDGDTTGDGLGDGRVFYILADGIAIDLSIEGFTITNGSPSGGSGGGIYAYAYNSGSILNLNLVNNIIAYNTAPGYGGGISANAEYGGSTTGTFINNTITDNTSYGGGIFAIAAYGGSTTGTFINNTITDNTSTAIGGGMIVAANTGNTSIILTNNIINSNIAPNYGGGIWLQSGDSGSITLTLNNNTITGNAASTYYGGGIFAYSYETGSSIDITMKNDILWGNSAGSLGGDLFIGQTGGGVTSLTATYSDIGDTYGSYTTDGTNLNTDPLFVDSTNGDYHLAPSSPLIDAGDNTGAPPDDFEGDSRPYDGDEDGTATVDIGADEYVGPPYSPPTPGIVTPSKTEYGTFVDSPFDLTTSFTDNESAVTSCEYTVDGSTWLSAVVSGSIPNYTCTKTGITGTDGQSMSLNMRATSSGGTKAGVAVTRTVDAAPPTTTDDSSSTWTSTSPVTVILSPSDGSGSGVASTSYCVDSTNSCIPGNTGTSVDVICASDSECVQYVSYFSTDNVGNQETTKSSNQIRQDRRIPTDGTLSATAGDTQVSLNWAGFDDDSGSGLRSADTYRVVRNTGSYPSNQCTNGTQIYLGSGNSTTDTGLTNGTTYNYRACAYDNAGNISTGATASATPNATNISPTADPNGPYTGIEGQSINLDGSGSSDLDGSIVLYEWDIDNNGTYEYSSSSPTQPHTYAQQGTYTIRLRVTDNLGATNEATTPANISDTSPTADFTGNPTNGTAPLTVNFINNSTGYDQPLSYGWDFDNDTVIDSTVQNPSYIYNDVETYTVKLTVTDSDGSPNTLTRTDYITVTFETCSYSPVKIAGVTPVYYTTLQTAYDAAVDGDVIQIQATEFTENLNINRDITVTLEGGYDCDYADNPGYTTINGSITLDGGPVIFDRLVFQ